MKVILLFSILLHYTVLQYKIPQPKPRHKAKQAQQSKIKIKIKHKIKQKKRYAKKSDELYMLTDIMSKMRNMVEAIEKDRKDRKFVKQLLQKKKCTKSYIGIGVHYDSFLNQKITKIGIGTPADKAGFKLGDHFVDYQPIQDVYPKGTKITVPIIRNGIMMYIDVVVDKVCTN